MKWDFGRSLRAAAKGAGKRVQSKQSERRTEVLLAAYQGENYVGQQIEAILAQTEKNWHATLSDDGSSDGTPSVLAAYAARMPERLTVAHSGRHFGSARDHFFWLLRQCTADYIFLSDQDDVWLPQKMEKTLSALRSAEREYGAHTPLLAFCDATPADAQLRPLAKSLTCYQGLYCQAFDYRSLLLQNAVTGGALCLNRALADKALQCADSGQTVMHDHWLAAVAARFGHIVYVDEPLYLYRQHGGNSVGAQNVRSGGYVLGMLRRLKLPRQRLLAKKRQARVFMQTYAAELTAEDLVFLRGFIRSRSGPLFYWRFRRMIHGNWRLLGMMVLG